jgi:hypothetical protein
MAEPLTHPRRFSVHARDFGAHHARLLEERSFEAAAVAFIEDLHGAPAEEISVLVRDLETGHEHCFRIDLTTGDAVPCADANESPP